MHEMRRGPRGVCHGWDARSVESWPPLRPCYATSGGTDSAASSERNQFPGHRWALLLTFAAILRQDLAILKLCSVRYRHAASRCVHGVSNGSRLLQAGVRAHGATPAQNRMLVVTPKLGSILTNFARLQCIGCHRGPSCPETLLKNRCSASLHICAAWVESPDACWRSGMNGPRRGGHSRAAGLRTIRLRFLTVCITWTSPVT